MAGKSNKYSYTKIDTYNQCGMKFKLQYIDGHYCFSGSIATEVGSAVHAAEEAIGIALKNHEPINYIAIKNELIVKIAKIEAKYSSDWLTPDKTGRLYRDKLYDYLNNGIYNLERFVTANPMYEVIGTEQKIDIDYGNYRFGGSIDRVFRNTETGRLLIQDIKTWAEPEPSEKLATPLQFVVYTIGASKLYNIPEDQIDCQYYLPFCHGQTQDAGTKGFMKRGRTKLDKLFAGIEASDWTPKPTSLCHWCNFCQTNENAPQDTKFLCPYFMHWTRENKDFSKEYEWQGPAEHENILEAYHQKYGIVLIESENT